MFRGSVQDPQGRPRVARPGILELGGAVPSVAFGPARSFCGRIPKSRSRRATPRGSIGRPRRSPHGASSSAASSRARSADEKRSTPRSPNTRPMSPRSLTPRLGSSCVSCRSRAASLARPAQSPPAASAIASRMSQRSASRARARAACPTTQASTSTSTCGRRTRTGPGPAVGWWCGSSTERTTWPSSASSKGVVLGYCASQPYPATGFRQHGGRFLISAQG